MSLTTSTGRDLSIIFVLPVEQRVCDLVMVNAIYLINHCYMSLKRSDDLIQMMDVPQQMKRLDFI